MRSASLLLFWEWNNFQMCHGRKFNSLILRENNTPKSSRDWNRKKLLLTLKQESVCWEDT